MKALVQRSLRLAHGPAEARWLNYPTPGIPRTTDGKPNITAPAPRTADGKPDLTGIWNRVSPKSGANIAADLKARTSSRGRKRWSTSARKIWAAIT